VEASEDLRPFAIITGASRGLGAEYARALAARGYDLLLVSRDKPRMDRLASDLAGRYPVTVDMEAADLAQPEAAHRLYAAARQRRGALDLLVNNAGFGLVGEFVDMPMARIQEMLRLHVDTIVESIRLFLPGMIERHHQRLFDRRSLPASLHGRVCRDEGLSHLAVRGARGRGSTVWGAYPGLLSRLNRDGFPHHRRGPSQ